MLNYLINAQKFTFSYTESKMTNLVCGSCDLASICFCHRWQPWPRGKHCVDVVINLRIQYAQFAVLANVGNENEKRQ